MAVRVLFEFEGGISVLIPVITPDMPLSDIIKKDVPVGGRYLIVDASDIPEDRTFRDAWTADFSNAQVNE